ncbi:MAG TPA: hypothetical protein VER97_08300 [Geodermatophilus sp.]|nr:hypothetical protein [Geodermatophilus sp.]
MRSGSASPSSRCTSTISSTAGDSSGTTATPGADAEAPTSAATEAEATHSSASRWPPARCTTGEGTTPKRRSSQLSPGPNQESPARSTQGSVPSCSGTTAGWPAQGCPCGSASHTGSAPTTTLRVPPDGTGRDPPSGSVRTCSAAVSAP